MQVSHQSLSPPFPFPPPNNVNISDITTYVLNSSTHLNSASITSSSYFTCRLRVSTSTCPLLRSLYHLQFGDLRLHSTQITHHSQDMCAGTMFLQKLASRWFQSNNATSEPEISWSKQMLQMAMMTRRMMIRKLVSSAQATNLTPFFQPQPLQIAKSLQISNMETLRLRSTPSARTLSTSRSPRLLTPSMSWSPISRNQPTSMSSRLRVLDPSMLTWSRPSWMPLVLTLMRLEFKASFPLQRCGGILWLLTYSFSFGFRWSQAQDSGWGGQHWSSWEWGWDWGGGWWARAINFLERRYGSLLHCCSLKKH